MATKSSPPEFLPGPRRPPKTSAPYPVLQNNLDDYRPEFSFRTHQVAPISQPNPGKYSLELQHRLVCPSLQAALANGQASLITRTTCSLTRTRLTHRAPAGPPGRHLILLDTSSHQGQVQHQSFIVSDEEGFYLDNNDWSAAVQAVFPDGVLLHQGSILALSERGTAFTEDATKPVSLIDVDADLSQRRHAFQVSLNHDRIKILLHPADFTAVQRLRSSPTSASALYPSLYLHAVHQAVLGLPDNAHNHLRWHRVISQRIEDIRPGLDLGQLSELSLEIAQQLIDHPLSQILPPEADEEDE